MPLPTAHSPLGASGSERWMICPGSVALSHGIDDPESEHAARGTVAHKLGEICLTTDTDAWEHITTDTTGLMEAEIVDKAMADGVQIYLDAVRAWHPERHQGNTWIERQFHCPTIHKFFYGTSDLVHLEPPAERRLHIWDYKNGAGVVVEVEDNPQLKYYAAGILEDLGLWDAIDEIVLHVAQPNGFHWKGPIRHWKIGTDDLAAWLEDVLVPAMDRALVSRDTTSGEHCRFCPARRHACPQLVKDFDELEALMAEIEKTGAPKATPEQVARFLNLFEVAKIVNKSMTEEAFNRLNKGGTVPGYKLASKRANREWRDGAEAEIKKKLGEKAYTKPELKSPAQIEALPEGEALVARWAFKPDTGLTVVKANDARPAVSKDMKSMFADQTKKARKRA